MKRLSALGFLLILSACTASRTSSHIRHSDVFTSGQDGYRSYRIPAIETAPDGTLLAFAEARKHNAADPGYEKNDIDLVLKRSADGGVTWSAMKVIEDPGELWSAANPATVVDKGNGRVWVLYLRSKPDRSTETSRPGTDDMQTMARFSDDSGATWSEPIDLTGVCRDMANPSWASSVVGPGGAIQDRKGRLIAPLFSQVGGFAIYSDDHGRTWQRGSFIPGKSSELQLVELSDGRILVDIRQQSETHRWVSTSEDGGKSWSQMRPGITVSAVACAIESYTSASAGADRNRIVWTGPKEGRKNLMIRMSYDDGQTFPVERMIMEGYAAYSDLAILKDQSIGILWERGVDRGYQFITFTRLTREFLEPDGKKP